MISTLSLENGQIFFFFARKGDSAMRSRIIVTALLLTLLSGVKLRWPDAAQELRSTLVPAVSREASVRGDWVALGRALAGETPYETVWARLTGAEESGTPTPSPSPSPAMASATGEFVLSEMVGSSLLGYEALVSLPSPSPAPSLPPPAESTAPATPSPAAAPIAPETLPAWTPPPAEPEADSFSTRQSEKITAFLETQAAFSEYAVPVNVGYEAPALPFDWIVPCAGGVTSHFGYRKHPLEDAVKFHYGLDLGAYEGDPVSAFADGTVLSVQELEGYGKTVLIQHDGSFSTLYAHCSQILVEPGAVVKRGERIALAGQTGKVTGPHLHFELLYNGSYLNPEFYLV